MNTQQIIAELRRSACEYQSPWTWVNGRAFDAAVMWNQPGDSFRSLALSPEQNDLRTFFLLVAEALESEA